MRLMNWALETSGVSTIQASPDATFVAVAVEEIVGLAIGIQGPVRTEGVFLNVWGFSEPDAPKVPYKFDVLREGCPKPPENYEFIGHVELPACLYGDENWRFVFLVKPCHHEWAYHKERGYECIKCKTPMRECCHKDGHMWFTGDVGGSSVTACANCGAVK